MNRIHIVIFLLSAITILTACKGFADPEVLMDADREFSSMSAEMGMISAFLEYAADSAVLLQPNRWPVTGKNEIEELLNAVNDTGFVLTWEPLYAKIAASADLGYTYGIYTMVVMASNQELKGKYVTIWEKQSDGSWKYILDGGNEGL